MGSKKFLLPFNPLNNRIMKTLQPDIKHHFQINEYTTIDMIIRVVEEGIIEITKRVDKYPEFPTRYQYDWGSYYLDSFDGSSNNDYPLEELIETIHENGYHDYKNCFWNHY